jgi:aconitate hydratase
VSPVDDTYGERAGEANDAHGGHVIVGGDNYGQGSSREHAAIAPRYLGLRVVLAKSYARIHWQNLANFGILALEFTDPDDHESIEQGDVLSLSGIHEVLRSGSSEVEVTNVTQDRSFTTRHRLSSRQVDMVLAGGLIPIFRDELAKERS